MYIILNNMIMNNIVNIKFVIKKIKILFKKYHQIIINNE